MARIEVKPEEFEQARKELASIGIILYNRKHRKGGYVCRASKSLRESLERAYTFKEMIQGNDIQIRGKL